MFETDRPAGVAGDEPCPMVSGLDASSAMVRAEADHLLATLQALVTRLSSVPGLELSVSYRQGKLKRFLGDLPYINDLNRRTGPIQRIAVDVGTHSYWLESNRGTVRCARRQVLPLPESAHEELTFSGWAMALFEDIETQNLVNHDSLVALRHLVEQDRVD